MIDYLIIYDLLLGKMKRRNNILNETNNCQLNYSVMNYRSVEKQNASCIARVADGVSCH
ncbi:MAG: hypothetical protein LBC68_13010 [Prevotellaceae bacterium]|nr:hypothetical protein [Prevotellaceae bacterium]